MEKRGLCPAVGHYKLIKIIITCLTLDYCSSDKQELEVSEKYSSLVNEAYKTLLEPMARGT